jgi:hypothetical protein
MRLEVSAGPYDVGNLRVPTTLEFAGVPKPPDFGASIGRKDGPPLTGKFVEMQQSDEVLTFSRLSTNARPKQREPLNGSP